MTERTWSQQQLDIFAWFENPDPSCPNLEIVARAGTGKTTTTVEGMNRAPESAIIYCAFNKRIVEEVKPKITSSTIDIKTMHALGFANIRNVWNVRVAQGSERADSLTEAVCGKTTPDQTKRLVSKLHTKAREMVPHAASGADLEDIALEFECEPTPEFLATPGLAKFDLGFVCRMAYEAMVLAAAEKPMCGIDFADMIYLPVRNGWLQPQYDLVVIDECQDMTVTQLEIAQGVVRPGGRIAVVGDDHQAIYGFRGADSGSLARLQVELQAKVLPLTTTYRCASSIVAEAQKLVPDFNCPPTAPQGEVRGIDGLDRLMAEAQPEDFILSRKNAPLATVAMAFIRAQKRIRIEGRDIGAGLKALVMRFKARSIPELLEKLESWERREIMRLQVAKRPESMIDAVMDKAATIRVLAEGVVGPQELMARIDGLFSDYGKGMVVASSVHRAKGLEADRVFVLSETLYAGNNRQEEENIHYVSITRARQSLVYVSGIK